MQTFTLIMLIVAIIGYILDITLGFLMQSAPIAIIYPTVIAICISNFGYTILAIVLGILLIIIETMVFIRCDSKNKYTPKNPLNEPN